MSIDLSLHFPFLSSTSSYVTASETTSSKSTTTAAAGCGAGLSHSVVSKLFTERVTETGSGAGSSTEAKHVWGEYSASPASSFFFPRHMCTQESVVDPALPRLSEKEIIVAGQIVSGGLGDFFNMLTVIDEITLKYPGQKIRLIVNLSALCYSKIGPRIICPPNVTVDILEYSGTYEESTRSELSAGRRIFLPVELRRAVDDAAYTVGFDTCDTPHYILPSPTFTFAESGWGASNLSKKDGIGICIGSSKDEKELSLRDISHPWLKEILTDVYKPSESRLAFVYFYEESGPSNLYHLICLAALEMDPSAKALVIVSNIQSLDSYKVKLRDALSSKGFSRIIIKSPSSPTEQIIPLSYDTLGSRTIFILNPFPLTHEDFTTLSRCSTSTIVGCTGDQSLCEVMKDPYHIPFYQILRHKIPFWKDYTEYSKKILGEEHPYVRYLELIYEMSNRIEDDVLYRLSQNGPYSYMYPHASKEHDVMLSLMRGSDFVSGAQRVHAAILSEKSIPKHIVAKIEDSLGIRRASETAAGGAGASKA